MIILGDPGEASRDDPISFSANVQNRRSSGLARYTRAGTKHEAKISNGNNITSMITDRIGRHEVLLPINCKNYNFREKKNSQVLKERGN